MIIVLMGSYLWDAKCSGAHWRTESQISTECLRWLFLWDWEKRKHELWDWIPWDQWESYWHDGFHVTRSCHHSFSGSLDGVKDCGEVRRILTKTLKTHEKKQSCVFAVPWWLRSSLNLLTRLGLCQWPTMVSLEVKCVTHGFIYITWQQNS